MKREYSSLDEKVGMFWHKTLKMAVEGRIFLKDLGLPLARIKRLMKVEEGVRMVASEVPVLFSMVTEKFIEELTLRAWVNTEENKRRILQKSDITAAVKTSETYDFLIYIIPRNNFVFPFNRLAPNKMHAEHRGFAPDTSTYIDSQIKGSRDVVIDSKKSGIHPTQDFYTHQQNQRISQDQIATYLDAHAPKGAREDVGYEKDFDMVFGVDMGINLQTDVISRPFDQENSGGHLV